MSPINEGSSGIDYLGLRQANLNLMANFLPGINNVTLRLRPYALMCWVAWAFREELKAQNMPDASESLYRRFREKVEVLFNWSHQLNNNGVGLVGNAQTSKSGGESQLLSFENWQRNVSWMDPVFYGPSLKDENGLGFLHTVVPKVFQVTESGERLALAFDECINKAGLSYNQLRSLDTATGTKEQAIALYPLWNVDDPSRDERAIFRAALFEPDVACQESMLGSRSASIELLLQILKAHSDGLSLDDLRTKMVFEGLSNTTESELQKVLLHRQGLWRVLQVRQAQRLAFEEFFGWLERQVLEGVCRHSSELVAVVQKILEKDQECFNEEHWLEGRLIELESREGSAEFSWSGSDESRNLFVQMIRLAKMAKRLDDEVPLLAIKMLLLCAVLAKQLEQNPYATAYLAEGGGARISLKHWAEQVALYRHEPLKPFLSRIIETYFISQHFGVAAARYTGDAQKLRLSIEEDGLTSLLKTSEDLWTPLVTADRLGAVLSLLADCEVLEKISSGGDVVYKLS